MTRRAAEVFSGLLVVAVMLVAGTAPASAHSQLLSSSPTDGERLSRAPAAVTLHFSADVLTIGAVVVVADDAGTDWSRGSAVTQGTAVTAALRDGAPDGAYQVRWRVVSADGHPISGLIPFAVGATALAPASAGALPPTTSARPTATSAEPAAGAASAAEPTEPTEPAGATWVRALVVGAVGAGAALALFWGYSSVRRRSGRPAPPRP
ncbi:copper resistance CopC family protein [Parafrankia sp. FMc2]|uniref:copper resistance CopC family protein n=1 Tax=Parafrankia sp. FMc2 TaxID=3233196 RepID=UPI0034D63281